MDPNYDRPSPKIHPLMLAWNYYAEDGGGFGNGFDGSVYGGNIGNTSIRNKDVLMYSRGVSESVEYVNLRSQS